MSSVTAGHTTAHSECFMSVLQDLKEFVSVLSPSSFVFVLLPYKLSTITPRPTKSPQTGLKKKKKKEEEKTTNKRNIIHPHSVWMAGKAYAEPFHFSVAQHWALTPRERRRKRKRGFSSGVGLGVHDMEQQQCKQTSAVIQHKDRR